MARSLVALIAFVLMSGCVSSAQPPEEPATPEPAQASRFVDGQAAAAPQTEAELPTDEAGVSCPLSNADLEDGSGSFISIGSEATKGATTDETTVYEECATALRWATTRASPDGLFLRLVVEAPEGSRCLAQFMAAGLEARPGPLALGIGKAAHGASWGMGSTGTQARIQVLGADSNDVLWGTRGNWAGGSGIGFEGGTWELTFAAQSVGAWDNELTQGWGAVLALVCEDPMKVTGIEASRAASLFDQNTLQGGASGQVMLVGGVSVQDGAAAKLEGESGHALAGAFSQQTWRLQLQHPEGTESTLVGVADQGFFAFSGKAGDYKATLDKVDRPIFSAWWLLLAGADGYDTLATFV